MSLTKVTILYWKCEINHTFIITLLNICCLAQACKYNALQRQRIVTNSSKVATFFPTWSYTMAIESYDYDSLESDNINEQSFICIPYLNDNGLWDILENGTVYRVAAESYEQAAQYIIDDLLTDNMVIL